MIDHLVIYTTPDLLKKTIDFYLAVLEPLGYKKRTEFMDGAVVGLGETERGNFWIASTAMKPEVKPGYAHFAFRADDRKVVDECYAKGLEAGGVDNGAPGVRPHYHPDYYGAFLLDPQGNNMEVAHRTD